MQIDEIIDFIKNSKKYSSDDFIFSNGNGDLCWKTLTYTIDEKKYKVKIYSNYSNKISFEYQPPSYEIKNITISIYTKYNEKKILSKFSELIRNIKKIDKAIKILNEQKPKIESSIRSFIKNEYGIDDLNFNGSNNNYFSIKFPKTIIPGKRRNSTDFNVSKEKLDTIKFEIYIFFEYGNFSCSLNFNMKDNFVILNQKNENYKNFSKDVTKIIRSEKLKNIFNQNE